MTALLSCIQLALHPKMAAEWPTTSSSARTKPAATAEVGRVTRAALARAPAEESPSYSDPGPLGIQLNEEKVKLLENNAKRQEDKIHGLEIKIKDLKVEHDEEAKKSEREIMKLNNTLERVLEENAELREVAKTSLVVAAEVVKMKEEMADMAGQMRNMVMKQSG